MPPIFAVNAGRQVSGEASVSGLHAKEWKFCALTDVWTGDAKREANRLILTGLLGSIRWWFEVLVRGLDGKACDPTDKETRCTVQPENPARCVVCELFGCTGWARKFRLVVLDSERQPLHTQIVKDTEFTLRFVPLRPIGIEEWQLLHLTIRLFSDYGAIGGKTVYKPSDENGRQDLPHHRDYGLVRLTEYPGELTESLSLEVLKNYVSRWRQDINDAQYAWASLKNFWFVSGHCLEGRKVKERYLARQSEDQSTFNRFVGREESKKCKDCRGVHDPPRKCPMTSKHPRRHSDDQPKNPADRWLAGSQGTSKKVFSFKVPEGGRTFGFVSPGLISLNNVQERLQQVWGNDFKPENEILTDKEILGQLLKSEVR